jgi:3-hydroxyisobutyrate dehydrogenase
LPDAVEKGYILKNKVAVIGLGTMGLGIARTLLASGFETIGCDLREEVLAEFEQAGGTVVSSPGDIDADCDAVLIVVVNDEQAKNVIFGQVSGDIEMLLEDDGVAHNLEPGAVVLGCSTVPPDLARRCAQRLDEYGIYFLDAPISGGGAKAAEGALSVMASGTPEAFNRAAPVLDAIAETVHRLGDSAGTGSTFKMINQLLAGIHIAAAAEAIAFGIKCGLNPQTLYEVITASAGSSWMFENRVPRILADDYAPHSAVDIFVKDLHIVQEKAALEHFPLPIATAASQLFTMATSMGMGQMDDAAVAKVYESMSNIVLPKKKEAN